jgi:hypothetical protein
MSLAQDMKRVPVIGLQPKEVTICETLCAMVILCDCGSTRPIVIPSLIRAGLCRVCKQTYVISTVEIHNVNGQLTFNTQVAKWTGPISASPGLDLSTAE